jgi:hypothetical protein
MALVCFQPAKAKRPGLLIRLSISVVVQYFRANVIYCVLERVCAMKRIVT